MGTEENFKKFCETIAALRHPDTGCPWDIKQDHQSLRRYMVEEAYEAADEMATGNDAAICEELGDVLLQVVLNAQVAQDRGAFTIDDVIRSIDDKMIRRHPHVFAGTDRSMDAIHQKWSEIKEREGKSKKKTSLTEVHPATRQANEIGKQARKINFDWQKPEEVLEILKGEMAELEEALAAANQAPADHVYEELGDVFFSWVQLCRHLNYDPELVATDGNTKFLRRFSNMEKLAKMKKLDMKSASLDELESLWEEAKRL